MSNVEFKSLYESIRARPGMYIGRVGSIGLSYLLGDLILDAAIILRAREIRMSLRKSGDIECSFRKSVIDPEIIRTTLAGQFGDHFEYLLPLVAAAALSTSFSFRLNDKMHKVNNNGKIRPLILVNAGATYREMNVTFSPDTSVFGTTGPEGLVLYQRMSEISLTNPDVKVVLRSDYTNPFSQIVAHCPGGVQHLLDLEASKCIGRDFEQSFYFNENGIRGQVGWFYANSYGQPPQSVSFANGRMTDHGGSHVLGLLEGIRYVIRREIGANKSEYDITLGRIANNLCLAISVWGDDFRYKGNTKACLEHELTKKVIRRLVAKKIEDWMTADPEKGKEFINRFRKHWPFHNLFEQNNFITK